MSVTLSTVLVKAEFTGQSSSGAISVPGLQVGDTAIVDLNGHNVIGSSFEQIISVADQIQQLSGSDLSSQTYKFFMVRWS